MYFLYVLGVIGSNQISLIFTVIAFTFLYSLYLISRYQKRIGCSFCGFL